MFAGAQDGSRAARWRSPRAARRDRLRLGPEQGLAGRRRDLYRDDVPGLPHPREVDHLVVAGASPQPGWVGARRPLDQDVERATDEALRALVGTALDKLDEPPHPLALHVSGDRWGHLRCLGPAPRREDEG